MAQPTDKEEWKPRYYYIMVNKTSGKKYVGQTTQDLEKYLGSGIYWKNHCKTYGGYTNDNIEVLEKYFFEEKVEAEKFLEQFESRAPKYWEETNYEWANLCKENTENNPFYDREIGVRNSKKRIEDGTHPFLRDNQSDASIYNRIGNEGFADTLMKKYGVDNALKVPEIAKKVGIKVSKTKSKKEWKDKVEPVRIEKFNETMEQLDKNGKTKRENRNHKIGEKNKVHNRKRVSEGKHQYQNGFYAVLKDGSTQWISSIEYKDRKKKNCTIYVHPTSKEGRIRREKSNGATNR
jgi:hypothetical protein